MSAPNLENQVRTDDVIHVHRQVKQRNISAEFGTSRDRVHHIITNIVDTRKVSARLLPRMLTTELKLQSMQPCEKMMKRYEQLGESFLRQIATGDELSWVHHYSLESKLKSVEYRHKTSPSPKKFKVCQKVLLAVFCDWEGIIHMQFLQQGHGQFH